MYCKKCSWYSEETVCPVCGSSRVKSEFSNIREAHGIKGFLIITRKYWQRLIFLLLVVLFTKSMFEWKDCKQIRGGITLIDTEGIYAVSECYDMHAYGINGDRLAIYFYIRNDNRRPVYVDFKECTLTSDGKNVHVDFGDDGSLVSVPAGDSVQYTMFADPNELSDESILSVKVSAGKKSEDMNICSQNIDFNISKTPKGE